jgi:hypothetical protein
MAMSSQRVSCRLREAIDLDVHQGKYLGARQIFWGEAQSRYSKEAAVKMCHRIDVSDSMTINRVP